jgi:adenosylcobinamide-GDP ribazoletransferase
MSRLPRLIGDVVLCMLFFTRLPMPRISFAGMTLARSIWAAPLAGAVVGLIAAAAWAAGHLAGLPAGPAAALALAAGMIASGCIHEDGLADTADGFGGGKTRERKLEIMRDSRIGTYGASALAVSALARWSALAELPGPLAALAALVAAHAASRALLPAFMAMLPPARADGLSADAGTPGADAAIAAGVLGAAALLLIGPLGAAAAAVALGLTLLMFMSLCASQIGGQTGDTTGALQQMAEIIVLMAAAGVAAP